MDRNVVSASKCKTWFEWHKLGLSVITLLTRPAGLRKRFAKRICDAAGKIWKHGKRCKCIKAPAYIRHKSIRCQRRSSQPNRFQPLSHAQRTESKTCCRCLGYVTLRCRVNVGSHLYQQSKSRAMPPRLKKNTGCQMTENEGSSRDHWSETTAEYNIRGREGLVTAACPRK